ncbi:MAG: sugar transferase [Terriglobia bacterium]
MREAKHNLRFPERGAHPLGAADHARLAEQPRQGVRGLYAPPPRTAAQRALKRAIDFVIALAGGIASLPLCAVIAAAIRLESRGPAIFTAKRIGENGKPFTLYKFRSMVEDAETRLDSLAHLNEGGKFMVKIPVDPRVTRVGRILRKYSLDEIPQMWNVIRGDMSMVGPRPQAPDEVAQYDDYQRRRLAAPAGITGWWQVTARHDPRFEVWVEKDLEYIDNWSIRLDLTILVRTFGVILGGRDASPRAARPDAAPAGGSSQSSRGAEG